MTEHEELYEWAGAYAAGSLDRADRERFEAHLPTCALCQATVADLLRLVAALARLPDDDLDAVDGLTPAPHTIAEGAVAEAHRYQRRLTRSRARWRTVAAAAVATAVLLLGGVWLATRSDDERPAGREVAMAGTASGAVELVAKGWGTELRFSLSGLPGTGPFLATVREAGGREEIACTWGPTPTGRVTIGGATSIPRDDLAAVEVTDIDGRVLATAVLTAES